MLAILVWHFGEILGLSQVLYSTCLSCISYCEANRPFYFLQGDHTWTIVPELASHLENFKTINDFRTAVSGSKFLF